MGRERLDKRWPALRAQVLRDAEMQDTPCVRCGEPIDYQAPSNTKHGPTVDHIGTPVSLGGAVIADVSELAPAHRSCNSKAGARLSNHKRRRGAGRISLSATAHSATAKLGTGDHVTQRDEKQGAAPFLDGPTAREHLAGPAMLPGERRSTEGHGEPRSREGSSPRAHDAPVEPTAHSVTAASLAACAEAEWGDVPWVRDLLPVPSDATWPRVMSPRHPRAVGSRGPQAIERIEKRRETDPMVPAKQKRLRWWQKLFIVRILEVDCDDKLVWYQSVTTTSRQVGKSVLLRELSLDRITEFDFYGEPQTVMQVAKDLSIANEIQTPARQWATIMEEAGLPWHAKGAAGSWAVEHHGYSGRWLIKAQTAVYGYSVSVAMLDEAWAIDVCHVSEGIEPTMVEREQPQLCMFSTPHRLATDLMPDRRRAAAAGVEGILVMEWSAPHGSDKTDAVNHRLASPHWDDRRRAFIAGKVEEDGFAEQWLAVWPEATGPEPWIPFNTWAPLAASLDVPTRASNLSICIHPKHEQNIWTVVASWREDDVVKVKQVAEVRSKKLALEAAAETVRGQRWTLLIPRVLRGQVPRIRGCIEIIYAGESDITSATTIIAPLIVSGRLNHDVDELTTNEVVQAVAEKYGEAKRLSVKLSPTEIERARAVILAAWWSTRDDRDRKAVVA